MSRIGNPLGLIRRWRPGNFCHQLSRPQLCRLPVGVTAGYQPALRSRRYRHFGVRVQQPQAKELHLRPDPTQPAAVFINPANWEGIRGSRIEAKRKKIPVLVVDAPASDPDLALCQVASDTVEAGRLACEALAQIKPNVWVVILHLSVNSACIDLVAGFKAELAKHPGMKVLDVQEGKGSTKATGPVMRDLLGRFPDLDAAFPINDPSALGCISAIESAGKLGQVTLGTVDGSREGAAAILAGKLPPPQLSIRARLAASRPKRPMTTSRHTVEKM